MVADKNSIHVSGDELLARAKLCAKLLEMVDEITQASELIKDGKYWDAYRVTNKIELMASEVSLDLHGIDIALGEEGKL